MGERIYTTDGGLNVRDNPAGSLVWTVPSFGVWGDVTDGPVTAAYNGTSYIWWEIDWVSPGHQTGWVVQNYITAPAPITPTPGTPGTSGSPGPEVATTIGFNWTGLLQATHYGIYVRNLDTNELFEDENVTASSFSPPASWLEPGSSYRWNLRSFNGTTPSSFSGVLYFQTDANQNLNVPDSPDSLSLSQSLAGISLTWDDNSNNEAEFVIERKVGNAGVLQTYQTLGANTSSFQDTAIVVGETYSYRVYAQNSDGPSGKTSLRSLEFGALVPSLISPGTATDTGNAAAGTLRTTFEWTPVAGASYYGLYVSREPYGSSNIVVDNEWGQIQGDDTSYTLEVAEALQYGKKYRWNMRAYVNGQWEEFSDALYFQTPLVPGGSDDAAIQLVNVSGLTEHGPGQTIDLRVEATGDIAEISYYRLYYRANSQTSNIELNLQPSGASTDYSWSSSSSLDSSNLTIGVIAYNSVGTLISQSEISGFDIRPVNGLPAADLDTSNQAPEPGDTVFLDGTDSSPGTNNTITDFQWSFNGSPFQSGNASQNHTIPLSATGQYFVRLKVISSGGESDIAALTFNLGTDTYGGQTPQSSAADPVNLATGNFYFDKTDFTLPGIGFGFSFSRHYNSKDDKHLNGTVGHRWTHTYNILFTEETSGDVNISWNDANIHTYTKEADGSYTPEVSNYRTLSKQADGSFTLRSKTQLTYHFAPFGGGHRFERITDRNNNTLTLNYDMGGLIDTIIDTAGRVVDFTSDASGRITEISDPLGRKVTYTYDANGDLTKVTDLGGGETDYTYDADHQILTITDPNGHEFVDNTYDALNRVVSSQRDALDFEWLFEYDFANGITTVSDPEGGSTRHFHDQNLRIVAIENELGHSDLYGYDEQGNRTLIVDKRGFITRYEYDERGNVTKKTDPYLNNTLIEYNGNNDPILRTDADSNQTQFEYDANGNLWRTTDAMDFQATVSYWPNGLPKVLTNARSFSTQRFYDGHGNLTREVNPAGDETLFEYDLAGRLLKRINAREAETFFVYDDANRTLSITNDQDETTSYEYDSKGKRILTRNALGHEIRSEYDPKDRLVKTIDPLEQEISYEYDKLDRRFAVTNKRSHRTTTLYDPAGRVLETRAPDMTAIARYEYDEEGNVLKQFDADGNFSEFGYDALGRLISTIDPLGRTTYSTYDTLGRVRKITDARNHATEYTYDDLGRLIEVLDAHENVTRYTYDESGNRLSMFDPRGKETSYEYDNLGRLIKETEPEGTFYAYTYDAVGNRLTRRDPNNVTTNYEYDSLNRLTKIGYPAGADTTFTYDALGRRTQMQDGLGTSTWDYDKLSRITSYTNPFTETLEYGHDENGNLRSLTYPDDTQVTYTYDDRNRMTSLIDWTDHTVSYSYDNLSRLTQIAHSGANSAHYEYNVSNQLTSLENRDGTGTAVESYALEYDPNGNPTTEQLIGNSRLSPQVGETSYSYDDNNRLISVDETPYQWDQNGNLINRDSDLFTWDYENRLTSTTVSGSTRHFQYDGLGVMYPADEATTWDPNTGLARQLVRRDFTGTITKYVYGAGLTHAYSGTEFRSFGFDYTGNATQVFDSNGDILETRQFGDFGQASPAIYNPEISFLGRYGVLSERETSLSHVRARFYDSENGRFVSKDLYTGESEQPQTLNRYVYGLNNPRRYVDPSGFISQAANNNLSQLGPSTQLDQSESNTLTSKLSDQELDEVRDELKSELLLAGFEASHHELREVILWVAKRRPPGMSLKTFINSRGGVSAIGEAAGLFGNVVAVAGTLQTSVQNIQSVRVDCSKGTLMCGVNSLDAAIWEANAGLVNLAVNLTPAPLMVNLFQGITGMEFGDGGAGQILNTIQSGVTGQQFRDTVFYNPVMMNINPNANDPYLR
ncbi:MAG: DUF6531 domain-containing protein [Roseibacillus sp.]